MGRRQDNRTDRDHGYLGALHEIYSQRPPRRFRRTPEQTMRYQDWLLDGVPSAGAVALDVGGGAGDLSFRVALDGAERVVCLEPGAAGSSAYFDEAFGAWNRHFDTGGRVALAPQALEEFTPAPSDKFDLLILNNVINHLDEDCCRALLRSEKAWARYSHFAHILYDLSSPSATLLIADCSNSNFFQRLGRPSPFAPSIDWSLHHRPSTWLRLFKDAGFEPLRLRWDTLPQLGDRLYRLTSTRAFAFFTTSHFALHLTKRE